MDAKQHVVSCTCRPVESKRARLRSRRGGLFPLPSPFTVYDGDVTAPPLPEKRQGSRPSGQVYHLMYEGALLGTQLALESRALAHPYVPARDRGREKILGPVLHDAKKFGERRRYRS